MWDEQAPLAEHFQVIRYDLRGLGETPQPRGEFSHLDDLHGLLGALGIERAHLLGCSKGGALALDYALEHPERTASVIFVASVPSGYTTEGEVIPAQWEAMVAAYKAGDFERAAELEAEIWVAGPRRETAEVDAGILKRVAEMDVIALRVPAVKRLGQLTAPLLIVAGDLDDPDVVKAGEWLAAEVPGARRVAIAGTAHFPNMEKPAEFNRVVLEFLKELEGRL